MIKNFIFDCGGVLAVFGFDQMMVEIAGDEQLGKQLHRQIFLTHTWREFDRGILSESQMREEILKGIEPKYHHLAKAGLDGWLKTLVPMPGMEDILIKLKDAGYGLYLISNFSKKFYEYTEINPILRHIPNKILSCDIHINKPDPKIFQYTFEKFNLHPYECVFIDDLVENINAAKEVGMHTHLFTTTREFLRYLNSDNLLTKD